MGPDLREVRGEGKGSARAVRVRACGFVKKGLYEGDSQCAAGSTANQYDAGHGLDGDVVFGELSLLGLHGGIDCNSTGFGMNVNAQPDGEKGANLGAW